MRVGIIGCGNIARSHAQGYIGTTWGEDALGKYRFLLSTQNHRAEVVYLCDIIEKNAVSLSEWLNREGNCKTQVIVGDDAYRKLLAQSDIDAVSVCVPPGPEKEHILIEAMSAGKHILCEKPLNHDLESALRIAASWNKKTVFAMCYNWRFTYLMQTLRSIIQQSPQPPRSISVVHNEPWNYTNPDSFYAQIGYLLEHNVHDIDYLRFLNGEIKKVHAMSYGRVPKNPCSLSVEFEYANGTKGLFQSANGMRASQLYITVALSEGIYIGTVSAINPDFEWQNVEYCRILGPTGEIFNKGVSSRNLPIPRDAVSVQGLNAGISHDKIVEDFIYAVSGHNPRGNVIDGYRDVRVITAIIKSLRTKSPEFVEVQ